MSNRKDVQQNSRRSPGSSSSNDTVTPAVLDSAVSAKDLAQGEGSSEEKRAKTKVRKGVARDRSAVLTPDLPSSSESNQWQESEVTVGGLPIRTYKPLSLSTPASGSPVTTGHSAQHATEERTSSENMEASWSAGAKLVCCINTYPNGITVSLHDMTSRKPSRCGSNTPLEGTPLESAVGELVGADAESGRISSPQQFHLRFRDTRDYLQPTGRYFLYREQYLGGLEKHLSQLHHQGVLENTVVFFGTTTDPFLTLHKKFDVTMACLQILERYTPKLLVVQTRSPMVISALPTLKHLGNRAVVGIPIETFLEKAVLRYTPGKPRIAERIIAADGLRKQGIRVNLMVSPVLPYGDYERDAWDFAELLAAHGDYVTFGALATGGEAEERALKIMPVAQKLAADRQFLWLRPLCYRPVFQALKSIAPEKLQLPVRPVAHKGQLNLFAA